VAPPPTLAPAQADGVVYSSEPALGSGAKALVRDGAPTRASGSDSWGSYDSLTLAWTCGESTASRVDTEVRVYAAEQIVTFKQTFPQGK
jgi:hypothetical protein